MSETEKTLEQKADEILALASGHPGPFMEDDGSFFGAKRVNPSMKDAKMETDCGGAIITKAKMTYGEADAMAASVDLADLIDFVRNLDGAPECYWKPNDGVVFHGNMMWAIFSYLTTRGLLKTDGPRGTRGPHDYHNGYEYLYDEILKRAEAEGLLTSTSDKWGARRWFKVPS